MFSPFGSINQTQRSDWRAEPALRGTYSIHSSCLTTMVLCVWTAVHLNLPEHNRAHTHKWRKLEWLLIGLFAPEMVGYFPIEIPNLLICRIQVAWAAFEQHIEARALCRLMRQAFGQPKLSSYLDSVIKFTRGVGGFNNSSPGSDKLRD